MFTLTTEHIRKATTYIPLEKKVNMAKAIAGVCLSPVKPKENDHREKALELIGFNAYVKEDLEQKYFGLLYTFMTCYFGFTYENDDFDYDEIAGSHIFNQLERFKADADLRNKIFDLLSDYKEFKKIVDTEIYNYKCEKNDFLKRLNDELSASSNPRQLIELVNELKAQSDEYKEAFEKLNPEVTEAAK